MITKAPPICPECGNNMCLLSPDIFAKKHLKGSDRDYYNIKKKDLDDFLAIKMTEHRLAIEKGDC